MICNNCGSEMELFGVNESREDKYHCSRCFEQVEGGRVTRPGKILSEPS